MKNPFNRLSFLIVAAIVSLSLASPLFSDVNTDLLNQAVDLVHQAWNPGGDPPANDQRLDLLNKAMKLAQDSPDHHMKGHRVKAILDIQSAIAAIQGGDADNKAIEFIRDADSELRTAISIAQ